METEIREWIKNNPLSGRREISKRFAISERKATELRKQIHPNMYPMCREDNQGMQINLESLKKEITGKRYTVLELCELFDVSPKTINTALDMLKKDQLLIHMDNTGVLLNDTLPKLEAHTINMSKHGEHEYVFGAIGDTHQCSKYERLDVLNSIYDRYEKAGVTDVFHAGNWIDGESRFNKTDLKVYGLGNQVQYFIDNYPQRKGIKTHIISGDDHEGWYVQRENINIGAYMQMQAEKQGRHDLIDCGYMERDFELKRPNGTAILRLVHAGGGSAYATSYTAQKLVESLQGGEKPQILFIGHYHKIEYGYPREVHALQVGCVQDQTPFMRKKKLQAHLGACIVRINQADNGIITSFNVEFMPYYDKKFYEYKW